MNTKITSFFAICIIGAILASCGGSSNPLIGEAESNVEAGNNEAALTAAEQSIEQYPNDPLGYFYKGVALGQMGQNQDNPSNATDYYQRMDGAFVQAESTADTLESKPEQMGRISAVRNGLWQSEHNQAVAYATDDSLMGTVSNPLELSVAHLTNATIIQPDSALSWEVLAQVNNMRENYSEAAAAQEKFVEIKANPDAQAYLLLSQYYRLDEKPEKAAEVLENAREEYPEDISMAESLADAYSQMGEADKAIATVEELVEKDPSNPQYRLSLGTRLYQGALEIQEEYDANLDNIFELQQEMRSAQGEEANEIEAEITELKEENNELLTEINELTDRAVGELNATIENRPDDAVAYNTLGIIYQNKAAVIFDQRNMTTDNQEASELDQRAKEQLEKAMTNYEKAAEIEPDNQQFWRSLFQVYTALGMDEKAAEAEAKAGMQ